MGEEIDPDDAAEGTQSSGSDNKQAMRMIQQRIGTGLNLSSVADKWAVMQVASGPRAVFCFRGNRVCVCLGALTRS